MECRFRRLGNDNEKSPPGVLLKRWWIGISTKKTSPYETWKIAMKHRKCSTSQYASHHERKRVEKREVFFLEKSDPTTWFLGVFTPQLPLPKLMVFLGPKKNWWCFLLGFFTAFRAESSSYVSWWNQFAACDLVKVIFRWTGSPRIGLVNF